METSSTEAVYYSEHGQLIRRSLDLGNEVTSVLQIPGPHELVSVNSLDTLLAVYGNNVLQIYALNTQSQPKRVYTDSSFSAASHASRIVQIGFHPYARHDGMLVVLTNTQLVAIYCPFGVDPLVETVSIQTPGSVPCSIAHFCFGSDDTLEGAFSLYLANADHDIYRLSPFIPPEIEIPVDKLAASSFPAVLNTCTECGASWRKRAGKTQLFKRDVKYTLPAFDGEDSLPIVPFPAELYAEDVVDMKPCSLGWQTDVILTLTTNHVNVLVLPPDSADSLTLVMSLDCFSGMNPEKQDERRIALATGDLLFVSSATETLALNISALKLSNYLRNGCSFGDVHKDLLKRTHVYATNATNAVTGFSEDGVTHFHEHSATLSTKLSSAIGFIKQPVFDDPVASEPLTKLCHPPNPASLQFDRPFIPAALHPNLQSVIDLHLVDKSVQSWFLSFLGQAKQQETDLQLLGMVSTTQQAVFAELSARIDVVNTKHALVKPRLHDTLQRQRNLAQRFTALLPGLHKRELHRVEPLSVSEKAWFDEIAGLVQKTSKLETAINVLASQSQNRVAPSPGFSNVSASQLKYLRNQLRTQKFVIDDLQTKYGRGEVV